MGKVRFSILEKPPDRILREDMKFKGMHLCALRFALSAARSAAQVALPYYVVVREASLTLAPGYWPPSSAAMVGGAFGAVVLGNGERGVDARTLQLAALGGAALPLHSMARGASVMLPP